MREGIARLSKVFLVFFFQKKGPQSSFFLKKKERKKNIILEEVKKNRWPKVSIIKKFQKHITLEV
jgi:hypothetical protein